MLPSSAPAPAVALTALCCALAAPMASAAARAEQKRSYDLPPGDAATTLNLFAGASGRNIIFMMDKVRGERTRAVRGEFAALDALRQMLAGTALFAVQDAATGALVVSRQRPAPSKPEQAETQKARGPPAGLSTPPPAPPKTTQPNQRESPPVKNRTIFALLTGWLVAGTPAADAQNTGTIEGRVFNVATAEALINARVQIDGTSRQVTTDESGSYRLTAVPAGEVRLTVAYIGMERESATVNVPAGGTVQREFELRLLGVARPGEVVKLDAFTVVADREMSAQALATNEQRAATNLKNVVALDQYGNQSDENIGEFLHFLPGVGVTVAGDDGPTAVSLRGFPSNYSNLSVGGGTVATARGTSRTVALTDVPFLNASRVEVTKVPTPDVPAAGLGGSINIIRKNGFEMKKPVFNYRLAGLTQSANGLTRFRWPTGQTDDISPKYTVPSVSLSYQGTLTDRVAITAAVSNTWRFKPAEDSYRMLDVQPTWNRVTNIQTGGAWQALPSLYQTYGGQLGFDFKLSPKDLISVGAQVKFHTFDLARSRLAVTYGTGATGGPSFTQGAATGVGSVAMGGGSGWYSRYNKQRQLNVKYTRAGAVWRLDLSADYSDAHYRELSSPNGYFYTAAAQISNLVIRGDDIPLYGIATRYTVRDRTGQLVDIYDGETYTINSVGDRYRDGTGRNAAARLNVTRGFEGLAPLTLRAGLAVDEQRREHQLASKTYDFRPNGASDTASRRAGLFDVFDEDFLAAAAPWVFGVPMREISNRKLYDLFIQNPSWFVLDAPGAHQSLVTNSFELKESIAAAYVRGDWRLLNNRLWLTGGVRFETTAVKGRGPLNDVSAQYRRNPDGSIVRNPNGTPVLVTNDALALRQLQYVERGARSSSDYDNCFPSLNSSYRVGGTLVFRAGYARTIGRPNVNLIVPGTTITQPDAQNPTITANNPGLLPWTANNYDLSIETYEIKGGSGSIGVFRKDVSNFFGSVRTPVTNALLQQQGLPVDGTYDGYEFATMTNAGRARILGFELSYRQNLAFLPGILKSLQPYANFTKLRTKGEKTADFAGFVPENLAVGINFIRPRYFVKLNYINQDSFRTTSVAPSTTELPDTFNFQPVYRRWGLNAEYSFSRNYTVFASASDLRRRKAGDQRAAPSTPEYAKSVRYQVLGYYVTFGVKGIF